MLGSATGVGTPAGALVGVMVTPVVISVPASASDPDCPCRIAPVRAATVTAVLPPMMAKGLIHPVLKISSSYLRFLSQVNFSYSALAGRTIPLPVK